MAGGRSEAGQREGRARPVGIALEGGARGSVPKEEIESGDGGKGPREREQGGERRGIKELEGGGGACC